MRFVSGPPLFLNTAISARHAMRGLTLRIRFGLRRFRPRWPMPTLSLRYSQCCSGAGTIEFRFCQRAAPLCGIFACDNGSRGDLARDQTAGSDFFVYLTAGYVVLDREA